MEREIGEYVIRPDPNDHRLPFVLGEGSFGVTYVAKHRVLNLPVALKVLKAKSPKPEIIDSFAQEARTLRDLRHPHIAAFENVGISNGEIYCAMELCGFGDLETIARLRGALSTGHLLTIALQAASALTAAHAEGYVHRDVKPSNLILARLKDGSIGVKLIDFGLSLCARDRSQGGAAGSPVFTSPEQMSTGLVDIRSDLYSLGITLWHLAAGRRPGQLEGSAQDVFNAHLSTQEFTCDEVPPLLKPLVVKLVRKNPSERFHDAPALTTALEALAVHFENTPEDLDLSPVVNPLRGELENLDDLLPREQKPLEQTYILGKSPERDIGFGILQRATTFSSPAQTVGLTVIHRGDRLKRTCLLDLNRQVSQHRHLATEGGYPQIFIRPLHFHVFPDNRVVIISDWVDGPPFEEILRMRRRFRFQQLLPMLLEMGAAIDFCHHRHLPIPDLSERGMTVVSSVSWSAQNNQDGVQSELKVRLSPLSVQSNNEAVEDSQPDSTVMQTMVETGDHTGEALGNPTALFACKIYRYVSGAPVSRLAFNNPGMCTAVPGLGSEANQILAGFIAQRQPTVAGCLGILEAICAAEGISLPSTGKQSSTTSSESTPPTPRLDSSSGPSMTPVRNEPAVGHKNEPGKHRPAGKLLPPLVLLLLSAGLVMGMHQAGLLRQWLPPANVSEPRIKATPPTAGESPPKTSPPVSIPLQAENTSSPLQQEIKSPPVPPFPEPVPVSDGKRLRPRLVPIDSPPTLDQTSAPQEIPSTKSGGGAPVTTDRTWEAGRKGWIFRFEEGRWVTVSPILSGDSASKRRQQCLLLSDADQVRGLIDDGWVYQPLPDGRVILARAADRVSQSLNPVRDTVTGQAKSTVMPEILVISEATGIPVRLPMDRSRSFTEQEVSQLLEVRYPREGAVERRDGDDMVLRFPTGLELRLSAWFILLQRD